MSFSSYKFKVKHIEKMFLLQLYVLNYQIKIFTTVFDRILKIINLYSLWLDRKKF